MKKTITFTLVLLSVFLLTSCSNLFAEKALASNAYQIKENSNMYQEIDSFTMENYDIYLFDLGEIENVPLNTSTEEAFYYKQEKREVLELSSSKLSETIVNNTIKSTINNYLNVTNNGRIYRLNKEDDYKFQAGIQAARYNNYISSLPFTTEESVEIITDRHGEYSYYEKFKFNTRRNETGYYLFSATASVSLYAYIAYDNSSNKIEAVNVVPILEKSKLKLLYSKNRNLANSEEKLNFDLNNLTNLIKPENSFSDEITVTLNHSGFLELSPEIEVKTYKLWDNYKDIPIISNKHYDYEGWFDDNNNPVFNNNPIKIYEDHTLTLIATPYLIKEYSFESFNLVAPPAVNPQTSKSYKAQTIYEDFDLDYLIRNGYQLEVSFSLQHKSIVPLNKVVLNIYFYNDGVEIAHKETTIINESDYTSTTLSLTLDPTILGSELKGKVFTKNVTGAHLKDVKITVRFYKP